MDRQVPQEQAALVAAWGESEGAPAAWAVGWEAAWAVASGMVWVGLSALSLARL